MPSLYDLLFPGMLPPQKSQEEQLLANASVQAPPLPNGGMSDEDLLAYTQQHPGPVAMVGNNPNKQIPVDVPAELSAPAPQVKKQQQPSPVVSGLMDKLSQSSKPASEQASMSDVIAKLMSEQDSELMDARQQRNQNQLMAILGKAGSQVGSAFARTAPQDTSGYDALYKAAGQPVEDLKERQALKSNQLKNAVGKINLETELSKQSPDNPISKIMKQVAEKDLKNLGILPPDGSLPADLTYNQLEELVGKSALTSMSNRKLVADATAERSKESRDAKEDQFTRQLNQRIESQTNNQVKTETSDYVRNLDQANRTQDIFKDIRSGKYKSSSNIAGALQSDISALLTGAKQTAVYDRTHAEIRAAEKTFNEILSFAQSRPRDTIPPAYLSQLEEEVETLKSAVIKNYQRKVKELESGTSNQAKKDIINNRFKTQLTELGYDPKSLEKTNSSSDSKEPAIQSFMQANGIKDREEAVKILKANGRL